MDLRVLCLLVALGSVACGGHSEPGGGGGAGGELGELEGSGGGGGAGGSGGSCDTGDACGDGGTVIACRAGDSLYPELACVEHARGWCCTER
jgi:hypothetical protein